MGSNPTPSAPGLAVFDALRASSHSPSRISPGGTTPRTPRCEAQGASLKGVGRCLWHLFVWWSRLPRFSRRFPVWLWAAPTFGAGCGYFFRGRLPGPRVRRRAPHGWVWVGGFAYQTTMITPVMSGMWRHRLSKHERGAMTVGCRAGGTRLGPRRSPGGLGLSFGLVDSAWRWAQCRRLSALGSYHPG